MYDDDEVLLGSSTNVLCYNTGQTQKHAISNLLQYTYLPNGKQRWKDVSRLKCDRDNKTHAKNERMVFAVRNPISKNVDSNVDLILSVSLSRSLYPIS